MSPLLTKEPGTSPGWTRADTNMWGFLKTWGLVYGRGSSFTYETPLVIVIKFIALPSLEYANIELS